MESPFTDRLNTGYSATDAEIPEIRQIISRSLQEHSVLMERAAQFEVLLNDIYLQMKNLGDQIQGHRTLICGFNSLPVELIQRIFYWCLPDRNSAMSSREAPLLLVRVCGTWRKIAFSTERLWSSLHIRAPLPNLPMTPQRQNVVSAHLDATSLWLSRSGDLPLSISFVDDIPRLSWDDEPTRSDLLDILLGFSHRWSHLQLKISSQLLDQFSHLVEEDFPILETAYIDCRLLMAPTIISQPKLPFLHSPSIRSVCLWNCTFKFPSALPLRWETLTSLSLTPPPQYNTQLNMNEATIILRRCPNLSMCAMEFTIGLGSSSDTKVHLPFLLEMRLVLITSLFEDATNFFNLLEVPQLRHLELLKSYNSPRLLFAPLLARPNEIDTLAFDAEASPLQEVLDCFSATPDLKRLFINSSFITNATWRKNLTILRETPLHTLGSALLSRLNPNNGFDLLCPQLEEIFLMFPSDSDVTDDRLLEFILSRTSHAPEGVARLKQGTFYFLRQRQWDIRKELVQVIRDGFDIQLNYSTPSPTVWDQLLFSPFKDIEISNTYYDGWLPRNPTQ